MVDRNVVLDEAVRAVETVTAEDAVRMLPREGWLPVLLRVDSFLALLTDPWVISGPGGRVGGRRG